MLPVACRGSHPRADKCKNSMNRGSLRLLGPLRGDDTRAVSRRLCLPTSPAVTSLLAFSPRSQPAAKSVGEQHRGPSDDATLSFPGTESQCSHTCPNGRDQGRAAPLGEPPSRGGQGQPRQWTAPRPQSSSAAAPLCPRSASASSLDAVQRPKRAPQPRRGARDAQLRRSLARPRLGLRPRAVSGWRRRWGPGSCAGELRRLTSASPSPASLTLLPCVQKKEKKDKERENEKEKSALARSAASRSASRCLHLCARASAGNAEHRWAQQ